jgi:ABC-2 type transport system ATP-binding protein
VVKVIEARDVVKRYGSVLAVDGLSLDVEAGEIFGLLGPNGAGKTTTAELLEGLERPDSGEIRVLGYDMRRAASQVKQRIGIQLQATALYQRLTVLEILALFGSFYKRSLDPREVMALVHLDSKAGSRAGELSGGQRQRLALGIALVNDPDLLFLDEPTTGLDPHVRCQIWDVIEALRRRGRTVLLTTHYMEEAERLCDRIVLMNAGRIVADGRPRELVRQHFQLTALRLPATSLPADELRRIPSVASVLVDNGVTTVYSRMVGDTMLSLTAMAARHGAELCDLSVRPATLEDVVLKLTANQTLASPRPVFQ